MELILEMRILNYLLVILNLVVVKLLGSPLVNREGEFIGYGPDTFVPTNEWQVVKPGQAVPKGIHVRLNIQTGERTGKLLEFEETIMSLNDDVKDKDKPTSVKVLFRSLIDKSIKTFYSILCYFFLYHNF